MTSHKFRTIVATATLAALAAGVSWFAAGPTGADACGASVTSGLLGCAGQVELRPDDVPGAAQLAPEVNHLAMAAGRLARQLGLAGLSAEGSLPGKVDLGGVPASWGMPSLTSASPRSSQAASGPAGMRDLSTAAHVAALPTLPQVPAPPGTTPRGRVAGEPKPGGAARPQDRIAITPADPIGVRQPVGEVGSQVIGELLPRALGDLDGSTVLPGHDAGLAGLTGLVQGLGLH
ncbi:hypothetical protein Nocox_01855 [Nonomuraea coxensis DSM 45129]|uniref:Secreted protein n=1 Tax=Nonomuraea coxensis DSM 45129 TaxID=1122611 RepID=A0ABX8TSS8_9ACTN|nr:hypothetical protein [Nonomuraea coxensis]QYC38004.1 hypothetical protein Nocox_01855 [Nonomuraea coxensis DSM 45129]